MFCCTVHILLHLFSQCEFTHSSALLVQFDKYLFILQRTSVSELSVLPLPTLHRRSAVYMQVKIFPFSDSINWNHREHNEFADVTLAYEDGQHIEAHKVILAVSSAFFQTLPK